MMTPQLKRFFQLETAGGIVLLIATVVAMAWANSPWSEIYHNLVELKFGPLTLHHWVNDGLMAIFFFLVGLEIKRELTVGELAKPRQAALPMLAAVGGMIVPALIYLGFNHSDIGSSGWGIPMATDIAFAVGVLAFARRVPVGLKIFLLALAIVDDLGAVLVIAFFYTSKISWPALAMALAAAAVVVMLRGWGLRNFAVYWIVGALFWLAVLKSGVHATVAGVILGLLTPARPLEGDKQSPLDRLVHTLHPWVNFAIMPIFALVNAGVHLQGETGFSELIFHPVSLGVILGLFIGKPVGIFLFSLVAVKAGWALLPRGVRWSHIIGVGFVAGIGFTMALFIASLALKNPDLESYSKMGILIGSCCSALIGLLILRDIKPQTSP